jgi:hypothetical protein
MKKLGAVLWGLAAATSPGWAADDRAPALDFLGTIHSTWSATPDQLHREGYINL